MDNIQRIIRTQRPQNVVACGYQKLTVTGASAQAFTVPSASVSYAEVRVESATTDAYVVRYLNLGATTLPTTTDGLPLSNGDVFDLTGADAVNNFRVIAVSGSHTLHIQFYK